MSKYAADDKRELVVIALSPSETHPGNYALVLEDPEGQRRIPLLIGAFEAQAIAVTMEQMRPIRPLTHDLLQQTIATLGGRLAEVVVYAIEDGTFFADLCLLSTEGEERWIDARPSDAIALAVRVQAPIFGLESMIEKAAVSIHCLPTRLKKGSLAAYSLEELEDLLARVIAKEDFESALRIRELIEKRREG